jgi:hypothetical protein
LLASTAAGQITSRLSFRKFPSNYRPVGQLRSGTFTLLFQRALRRMSLRRRRGFFGGAPKIVLPTFPSK